MVCVPGTNSKVTNGLAEWEEWTTCTEECDGGKQQRIKMCDDSMCGKVETSCHLMACDGK